MNSHSTLYHAMCMTAHAQNHCEIHINGKFRLGCFGPVVDILDSSGKLAMPRNPRFCLGLIIQSGMFVGFWIAKHPSRWKM